MIRINWSYASKWEYTKATNTITVKDDVTIIGNVTGTTDILKINIAAGKTVKWNAAYTSSALNRGVELSGSGTFDVSGGSITKTSDGSSVIETGSATPIIIRGGTVRAAGNSACGIWSSGNVTVIGGTVTSASSDETISAAGDVEVSRTGKVENTGTGA